MGIQRVRYDLPIFMSALFGFGAFLVSIAAPEAFPELPSVVWKILFFVGIAMMLFALVSSALSFTLYRWVPMWKVSFNGWLPFRRLVPLQIAARIAYEKLDGTVAARTAEKPMNNQPGNPIQWFATAIIGIDRGRIPIYGVKPGQQKITRIPDYEIPKCTVTNDASALERWGNNNPRFTEIAVTRSDLNMRIKEIKGW